jgi:hypothetical protein
VLQLQNEAQRAKREAEEAREELRKVQSGIEREKARDALAKRQAVEEEYRLKRESELEHQEERRKRPDSAILHVLEKQYALKNDVQKAADERSMLSPPALPHRPEQVWSANRPTRLDNVAKAEFARLDNTLQSDSRFVYPDGSDFRQSIAGYDGNGPNRRAGELQASAVRSSLSQKPRSSLPLPEPAPHDVRPMGGYGSKGNVPVYPFPGKEGQRMSAGPRGMGGGEESAPRSRSKPDSDPFQEGMGVRFGDGGTLDNGNSYDRGIEEVKQSERRAPPESIPKSALEDMIAGKPGLSLGRAVDIADTPRDVQEAHREVDKINKRNQRKWDVLKNFDAESESVEALSLLMNDLEKVQRGSRPSSADSSVSGHSRPSSQYHNYVHKRAGKGALNEIDPFGGMPPLDLAKLAGPAVEALKGKKGSNAIVRGRDDDDDDDDDYEMDLAAERAKLRARKAQQQAKNVIGGASPTKSRRSPSRQSPRSPRAQDLYKPVGDDSERVPLAWEKQVPDGNVDKHRWHQRPPSGASRASSSGTTYSEFGL